MSDFSPEPYKGVRDFYPKDKARLTALFAIIRDTLARHGYEEYDASPLERSELYSQKTSEEIVSEQTYTFTDRGDRSVTLRPEMTPTLARMVSQKRRELALPLRWYSIGNRFRYERPQKGRLREFYQVDVDLVGVPHIEADIEVILLAREVLHSFGAGDGTFSIRINSRELLTAATAAAGLDTEKTSQYLRLLDRKSKLDRNEYEMQRDEILNGAHDPLTLITQGGDKNVDAAKESLNTLLATLKNRGATNVVFDPTLVRGFDYYTGTIFEIFDADPENGRSLFGGGRYDNLIGKMGGEEVPAVGFALGDVTLTDFLEGYDLLPEIDFAPHIYLATPTTEDIPAAQEYATLLRNEGLSVFVNLADKKIGDQIKDAEKRNIQNVIVYGEKEANGNLITLKNINTGDEQEMAKDSVLAILTDTE